ncbi:MAG: glycosyltransferase family 2 protein [Abditibacteriales bacterium]|nr:glycosyltransferase family 2 protein [Abditibacteriales bacterium]MDW8365968.1 glycosyltransferase family 2 protein [Abditibacteriales bacterium]
MFDLSISIAHLGGKEMLADCLRSLLASFQHITAEITVVDNASRDGSVEMMAREFPSVRLIRLSSKQGFTANHNLGLRGARGRYVCILNNDTLIRPGAFDRLVQFLDEHPECGVAAPMIFNPDGTAQPCCGPFVTLWSELSANILPARWVKRPVEHQIRNPQSAIPNPCYPDWVGGVCLVARRAVWEKLGGLDEGFYIFFEETDFCRRARHAGWKVAHVLDAEIVHFGGQNTGEGWMHETKFLIYCRSQLRYFRKHHRLWELVALRVGSAIGFLLKTALWSLISLAPSRRAWAAAHVQVFRKALGVMMGLKAR